MSKRYQVLARKYRPQTFRDVVGQEATVTTLKNAIRFNKIAHAYLFCGSRGVGKTTLARLFAKALNCQNPSSDLEPCNECPSCLEISSGQSMDVVEIDGASNRGIDDIRQINETVGYAPSHGKYKIILIDEVHMLTKEAFNALLKTLEEPPERAKFFFATTEPQKVLPTIISRCQRFDLARISNDKMAAKLAQIATDLSRTVEPEALELIARFAEGSLRDAESLFDQILCFSDETITAAIVRQSLGLAPQEIFLHLDQAFSNYHLAYAFELVDQLFQTGKDLAHFFEQLIEHYRDIVHAKIKPDAYAPVTAKLYTQAQALHILDLLIEKEASFQKSAFQRVSLESILLQLIRSKNRIPIEVLVRSLTDLKAGPSLPPQTVEIESAPKWPKIETILPSNPLQDLPSKEMQEEPKPIPPQTHSPVSLTQLSHLDSTLQTKISLPSQPVETQSAPQLLNIETTLPSNPIQAPQYKEKKTGEPKPIPPQNHSPVSEIHPSHSDSTLQTKKPLPSQPVETESAPQLLNIETNLPSNPIQAPHPKEKKTGEAKPIPPQNHSPVSEKHPSHYDTMMRFAAVELEGTVK